MKKSTKIILMISICLISVGIVLSAIGRFAGASPRHILFDGLWNASFRYGDDFDNCLLYTSRSRMAAMGVLI